MALEVEIKAHTRDAEEIGRLLRAAGSVPVGEVDKDDRYVRSANGVEFRIRFRGENGGETRRPTGGCDRVAVKRKRGSLLRRDGLLAEIVEVERLGWFVEIECMVEDGDGEQAASEIRRTLDAIGVDSGDVESRTYLQLLGFER